MSIKYLEHIGDMPKTNARFEHRHIWEKSGNREFCYVCGTPKVSRN